MFDRLIRKLVRRETPFWDRLYRVCKAMLSFSIPGGPVHRFLYAERRTRHMFFAWLGAKFYYEPMLRARCAACGPKLQLIGGIPLIMGDLELRLGEGVIMHGYSTLTGSKLFEHPLLSIGDNTILGYGITIAAGREVSIGKNVLIANHVTIFADDMHPVDPFRRAKGEPSDPEQAQPVHIHDMAWIGEGAKILKGVTIGKGSIIGAGSVVTKDIPAFSIAAGNPARVLREIAHGE